jgi:predicted transcriptional regulator
MGLKRSKEAIICKILEICANGATKTAIVYQGNLNFHTVEPYLDRLKRENLIEQLQQKRTRYKTTQKGRETVEAMNRISQILGPAA